MKFLSLLLPAFVSASITIPQPQGPFGVSAVDVQLNDTTRKDAYNGKPFRLLPITVITPTGPSAACHPVFRPYMRNASAYYWESVLTEQYKIPLNGTLSSLSLALCTPQATARQYPLIFFSQGLGFPRQFYSIFATNLASQGYTVVQVGIPGEIPFIEFPDGHIETSNPNITDAAQHSFAMNVRVDDINFVLEALSSPQKYDVQPDVIPAGSINTTSPAIYGHSFGGSTALSTLFSNSQFISGANEDGRFWGSDVNRTTDRPFMILASTPGYIRSLFNVTNWAETWPHLEGPKWLISVKNSTHDSFVDVHVLAEYFGWYRIPGLKALLGEIDPWELIKIQVDLLCQLDKVARGSNSSQSVGAIAERFDDVVVLNSTDATIT